LCLPAIGNSPTGGDDPAVLPDGVQGDCEHERTKQLRLGAFNAPRFTFTPRLGAIKKKKKKKPALYSRREFQFQATSRSFAQKLGSCEVSNALLSMADHLGPVAQHAGRGLKGAIPVHVRSKSHSPLYGTWHRRPPRKKSALVATASGTTCDQPYHMRPARFASQKRPYQRWPRRAGISVTHLNPDAASISASTNMFRARERYHKGPRPPPNSTDGQSPGSG